jgi:hypothetical protein
MKRRNHVDLSIESQTIWSRGKRKALPGLVLNGSKDFMKQMRAHEMSFKQPQNEAKLSPK